MTIGALWRSAPTGGVNEDVVDALRRSLGELPAADDPLRCRVMLALANELPTVPRSRSGRPWWSRPWRWPDGWATRVR